MKKTIVGLTVLGVLGAVITLYFLYTAPKKDAEGNVSEATYCGSTIPITCSRYRCENGYLVGSNKPQIPGGGPLVKMCTDGSIAEEVPQ